VAIRPIADRQSRVFHADEGRERLVEITELAGPRICVDQVEARDGRRGETRRRPLPRYRRATRSVIVIAQPGRAASTFRCLSEARCVLQKLL
jgi:hypothetical protein